MLLLGSVVVSGATIDPSTLVAGDVGSPNIAGLTTVRQGAVEVTAGGQGIRLQSDQFHFAAAPVSGDFDVRVRVATLKNTDLWAKAGLMARAGRSGGARFAGVFATPTAVGCLFQARDTDGSSAANQGFFPANQPITWLRLRREGDTLTGYAGYDGRRWTVLGTRTVTLGSEAILGLAVTSHSSDATTAEFCELSDASDAVVEPVHVPNEPLGPSNRRGALVISEIMYHPPERADGKKLEFVELYNSQPYEENISGWKLAGQVDYTFPPGTIIPGGGFLVVAAAPQDLQAAYGLAGVLGPTSGKLSNGGGTLRLIGEHNGVFQEVKYGDSAPWPLAADGGGHSLVLARPSYGEGNPRAWSASRLKGGSPGLLDAVEPTATSGVRINEWLLPDENGEGFVELFNAGAANVDLSGVRLGDAPDALPFAIPAGTKLDSGGFVQFTWKQLGFSANPAGGKLYMEAADQSRFLDALKVGSQRSGQSAGRWPNGGSAVRPLLRPTPGAANARPQSDIVISEIHYQPITRDSAEEFVELLNAGSAEVDLSGWRFVSGVDFTFPQGTLLPAGNYLVVARNVAKLRQIYPKLDGRLVVGDFQGGLSGRGERLVLSRPVLVRNRDSGKTDTAYAEVTEAVFSDGGRWHRWSDGGGSTLELLDPRADASMTANWADSDESKRSEWTTVEATGVLDNTPVSGGFGGGFPGGGPGGGAAAGTTDGLQINLMGEGECLVDNIQVIGPDNTNRLANGIFENGTAGWTSSGNHIQTSLSTSAGDQSSQSLHLRASNNGDTGANKIYAKLSAALRTNQTVTIRARVKWLRGWPEILIRLRGNYLEAYGRLSIPVGPGTPGEPNGRAVVNAGPAIADVSHFPVVPEADQPVVVVARIDDPDGIGTVTLHYRVDPDQSLVSVTMHDDGTQGDSVAGDGIYSGLLPGAAAGKVIAFTVEAKDQSAAAVPTVFPPGAPARECLVRFGEGVQSGAFGTYRLWLTQANANTWQNRPNLSNEPVESTFVYGNWRAVYNAGGRFAGSPYHQNFRDLRSDAHYVIEFPKEDRVLGATALNKIHAPGNGPFDDTTLQREQAVYWMARQMDMPWLYRRFVHVYINGSKRKTLMEDTQVGNDDFVAEYWPDDSDGHLFKMQPWFEFNDGTAQSLGFQNNGWCFVQKYLDKSNQHKARRYRWNWLVRGAEGTANDFSSVYQLAEVTTDFANPEYSTKVESLVDVDEWMRFFALNHAAGNWDSIGYQNCQNTYSYKPRNGRWELIIWDANIVFGNSRSDGPSNLPLFTTSDPTLTRWFASGSPFRRRLLSAYYELVNGPMQSEALASMLEAKYAAFQEHGVSAQSPAAITTWLGSARNYILSQISKDSAEFAVTGVEGSGPVTLTGTGPLNMVSLQVNGEDVGLTWESTKSWQAAFIPRVSTNRLVVVALNRQGESIATVQQDIALAGSALAVLRDGTDLVFEYPVTRSGRYQIQATPVISSPVWRSLAEEAAHAGILRFRLPAPTAPTTFYRLLEL